MIMIPAPRLYFSAAHKSSGKTTVTLGVLAALNQQNMVVQPFKKGPDYIDPLWLGLAANRSCYNLDFFTMERHEIQEEFARRSQGADFSIIEGNKGLYDGLSTQGEDSNAALATLLDAPVILILDAEGITRGVAPLLLGYQTFDSTIHLAGVILNKVQGSRHEKKLRDAISYYTDIPVLGAVHRDESLMIRERHLGLIPSNEQHEALGRVYTIAKRVAEQIDLDQLTAIGRSATPLAPLPPAELPPIATKLKLGIAKDAAFGFYYPGDLEALATAGAELCFFDTLKDQALPPVDALFIGGGFPETQQAALAANSPLREAIRQAILGGLPTYAECGGLMYLSRSITWEGETFPMVGAIPADTLMTPRPVGRGYIRVQETGQGPWPLKNDQGNMATFAAHEFHYSKLVNLAPETTFAYQVLRGFGIDGHHDGIVLHNTLGAYLHQRNVATNRWAERFIHFVAEKKH